VVTTRVFFASREAAGAASIRHSLRPLSLGDDGRQDSGGNRENAKSCLIVICEPTGPRERAAR
jgi:hypothetical protein